MKENESVKSFGELPTLGHEETHKEEPRIAADGPSWSTLGLSEAETLKRGAGIVDVGRTDAARRWAPGDVILDRYVVEGELGQGGMGVVYACLDRVGGVRVAVKCLPPELSHNTVEMEEVRENFKLVGKLAHPNIAVVRHLEKDGRGEYFLVMDIADGVTLRQWGREKWKSGGVSVAEAVPILRQVAAALDYAHGEKVIHRDVKPGNVMIDGRGRVKVLDFGLAAQIRTSLSRASQAYRGTSGTGPYMAPEQWRAQPQDAKTDQYALGVMAYEMLAGRLPFENPELEVLKKAVLEEVVSGIVGVGAGTMKVLRRAMAKEAEGRFGSCGEFVEALAESGGGGSGRQSARGRNLMGWAAALVLAGAVGAGVWWKEQGETAGRMPALRQGAEGEAERLGEERKAEEERLAAQKKAEEERRAEEVRKAEEERLAAQKAEEEKARLEAERARMAEEERLLAQKKAEEERRAEEARKAEEKRLAAQKAAEEKARVEAERERKAEEERLLAQKKAEEKRRAEEARKAEEERLAAQKAAEEEEARMEAERARKAEEERLLAQKKAEEERRKNEELEETVYRLAPLARTKAANAEGMGYERKQGFGGKLDEMKAKLGQGEAAMKEQNFGKAKEFFEASITAADWCAENAPLREAAGPARAAAEEAQKKARAMDGEHLGLRAWREGEKQRQAAEAVFEDGRFKEAADAWDAAGRAYAQSEKDALEAKVSQGLEAAHGAQARGAWEECLDAAEGVLAMDAKNALARGLKAEAARNLKPGIVLKATLEGREVEATVTEGPGGSGGRTTPVSMDLAGERSYVFALVYKANGKKYEGRKMVSTKAHGVTEATVVLEKVKELETGTTKTITLPGGAEMEVVWCPPGSFMMGGAHKDEMRHRVTLTDGFWMAKYEVTQEQWKSVMGPNPSHWKGDNLPVENVSWDDCQEFCRRCRDAGIALRLPTEAEWEYACRAGSWTEYFWGNALNGDRANCDGNRPYGTNIKGPSKQRTVPVGSYAANSWGLHDMHGNVQEWCEDWYDRDYYSKSPGTDPTGPTAPSLAGFRVARGGSWNYYGAKGCRSSARDGSHVASSRSGDTGFRPCAPQDCHDAPKKKEAKAGTTKTIALPGGATMEMVWCPSGTFTMGENDGRWYKSDDMKHRVTLTEGFWMAKTEVTQKQWKSVMGNNPSHWKGDNLPVERVSWDDCQEFCRKTGLRLPTDAEWEYACRAWSTERYGGTGQLSDMGWYGGTSLFGHTHPVGEKQANDWGLHDMHGNVSEWCSDWFAHDLGVLPVTNPTGAATGVYHVLRGGSWGSSDWCCRSASRRWTPDSGGWLSNGGCDSVGFRPVCSAASVQ